MFAVVKSSRIVSGKFPVNWPAHLACDSTEHAVGASSVVREHNASVV